ncbi:MAG: DUF2125 domain-containing protein [Hyphomonadaceae bacterium JAD_PAG50586_4]|nr:MAG: DUF2125 domain-containing protein [Hyphomonadaceae bacterium JAD_PAG50586_4]
MKSKYLWLAIPWAVAVLLAIGWTLYWNTVAGQAERRLNDAIAEQQAQGATASIGAITRHGFPAILRLQLNDIAYAPARGAGAPPPHASICISI